jgi:tRNA A37 threonylcarbamoyladenosine dehydratase
VNVHIRLNFERQCRVHVAAASVTFLTGVLGFVCADTELEAEVEPSMETEERLRAEAAAREEAERAHQQELARLAQVCAAFKLQEASHVLELLLCAPPGNLSALQLQ